MIAFLLCLCQSGPSPTPALDSTIAELMKRHRVPGAAMAIVHGPDVRLAGFGYARLQDSLRVDPTATVFRLGSVGKLFVATAAAREMARGRLALDADIRPLVPNIPLEPGSGGPVTLRQLLTHTAGFDERLIGYAARTPSSMQPLGKYLEARMPARGWPAGSLVGYSNHGVSLAALVVETVAGVPFRDYAARELFQPLGMTRTFYLAPDSSGGAPGQAAGYRCSDAGCAPTPDLYSNGYPVGLVYSTAADMGRFVSAQLNGLPAADRAILHRRHFSHHPALRGLGLGFFEQSWNGITVFAHSGVVPGYASLFVVVPDRQLGFFVATNGGNLSFGGETYEAILTTLLGPRAPVSFATVPGSADQFAGSYRMTRYAHRTVERFPLMFVTGSSVDVAGDTLMVPFGGRRLPFLQVDSLLFREVGGERMVAFAADRRGRPTHMFAPALVFGAELGAAFERTAWYAEPYFLNEYVSWLLLGPILAVIAWGLVALAMAGWRRYRRIAGTRFGPGGWLSAALAAVVPGLFGWFGFGFVARSTRDLSASQGMVLGLTPGDRGLLLVPFVHAFLTLALAGLAIEAWRRDWHSLPGRVLVSLVAAGAVLQVHFLVVWNYLPARW